MKIKFFKKESLRFKINQYWELAVCFVFVVILLSSVFGYFLFRQLNKEVPLVSGENLPEVKTISKGRIDKTLEYFSLREKASDQILNSPSPFADPSL